MANFETALTGMKNKERWRRRLWPVGGDEPFVRQDGKFFVYIDGKTVTRWSPHADELLADDWERVGDNRDKRDDPPETEEPGKNDERLKEAFSRAFNAIHHRVKNTRSNKDTTAIIAEIWGLQERVRKLEGKSDG